MIAYCFNDDLFSHKFNLDCQPSQGVLTAEIHYITSTTLN